MIAFKMGGEIFQFLSIFLLFSSFELAMCHGGRGGGGSPMSFLRNLDQYSREKFFTITRSSTKTKAELKAKLEEWAKKNGVQEEYQQFMQNQKKTAKKLHDTALGNLAGPALELFNKIWETNQNDELTFLQDCTQIREAFEEAQDPLVGQLVASLLPPKPLPGPAPHGCQPIPGMRGGRGGHGHGGGHHGHGGHHHGGGGRHGGGGKRRGGSSSSSSSESGQVVEEGRPPNVGQEEEDITDNGQDGNGMAKGGVGGRVMDNQF